MVGRYFQKPDTIKKKAQELLSVGKQDRALDLMYEFIRRGRHRQHNLSEKELEPIMVMYLELCVDMRKSHNAKEGLFQYRNFCQNMNVASLEFVVKGYLSNAETKTDAARKESKEAVEEVDDLDNIVSPEQLMLSAVSSEDKQDRLDRTIVAPWVRFLWESYRQCMELLKTNSRVETLYHSTAKEAFRFCLKYQRKTEFRKLCEIMRKHLDQMKQPLPTSVISLSDPDTLARHMGTWLALLDTAVLIGLWQEAHRAISELHALMVRSRTKPRPQMLVNYYTKMALVFAKSGNWLLHAAAMLQVFRMFREQRKNVTAEKLNRMADRVIMAVLSVPLAATHLDFDPFVETEHSAMEKAERLASLLSLRATPTRSQLLHDVTRYSVLTHASACVARLFALMEPSLGQCQPLTMCAHIAECLDDICAGTDILSCIRHKQGASGQQELTAATEDCSEGAGGTPLPPSTVCACCASTVCTCDMVGEFGCDLYQYVEAVIDVAQLKFLKQIAEVYDVIQFSRLISLCPFTTQMKLERVIVEAVNRNQLQACIQDKQNIVCFGLFDNAIWSTTTDNSPAFITTSGTSTASTTHYALSSCDHPRVGARRHLAPGLQCPYLQLHPSSSIQSMPFHQFQAYLYNMCTTVVSVDYHISADQFKMSTVELRNRLYDEYVQSRCNMSAILKSRCELMEQATENIEKMRHTRDMEEQQRQEEMEKRREAEEHKRLESEATDRQQRASETQAKRVAVQEHTWHIKQMQQTSSGSKLISKIGHEQLMSMDVKDIMAKQREEMEKDRREQMQRLLVTWRRIDHTERAKRLEEIPVIKQKYVESKEKNRQLWDQQQKEAVTMAIEERAHALEQWQRLSHMVTDKDDFISTVMQARDAQHKADIKQFDEMLAEVRAERLQKRKEEYRNQKRIQWQAEQRALRQKQRLEEDHVTESGGAQAAGVVDTPTPMFQRASIPPPDGAPTEGSADNLFARRATHVDETSSHVNGGVMFGMRGQLYSEAAASPAVSDEESQQQQEDKTADTPVVVVAGDKVEEPQARGVLDDGLAVQPAPQSRDEAVGSGAVEVNRYARAASPVFQRGALFGSGSAAADSVDSSRDTVGAHTGYTGSRSFGASQAYYEVSGSDRYGRTPARYSQRTPARYEPRHDGEYARKSYPSDGFRRNDMSRGECFPRDTGAEGGRAFRRDGGVDGIRRGERHNTNTPRRDGQRDFTPKKLETLSFSRFDSSTNDRDQRARDKPVRNGPEANVTENAEDNEWTVVKRRH